LPTLLCKALAKTRWGPDPNGLSQSAAVGEKGNVNSESRRGERKGSRRRQAKRRVLKVEAFFCCCLWRFFSPSIPQREHEWLPAHRKLIVGFFAFFFFLNFLKVLKRKCLSPNELLRAPSGDGKEKLMLPWRR